MYSIVVFGGLVALAKGSSLATRIVNGNEASIMDFPYQVSVQFDGKHVCGGSILNSRHILTAAHCIEKGEMAEDFKVRAGSSKRAEGGQLVDVVAIHSHPDFDVETWDYDVSVFVLAEDLVFDENVKTITLAEGDPKPNTNCTVSGWGYLKEDVKKFPEELQEVNVPIISRADCMKMYKDIFSLSERMLCAGYRMGKRDACQGDSGGPLVCNGVQVGISSFGLGCARRKKPGVYASVATLKEFIDKKSNAT